MLFLFESTNLLPTLLLGQEKISNTFILFEAWFHVAQDDFKLELSDDRCAPPCLIYSALGTEPRLSYVPAKHSTPELQPEPRF